MAKNTTRVKNGKSGDGIYQSWAECEAQVKGAPGVLFKGFATRAEAEAFLQRAGESPAEEDAPSPPSGRAWPWLMWTVATTTPPRSSPAGGALLRR